MSPPNTDPLQWLNRSRSPKHLAFNPLYAIGAVNGFIPMGKAKALSLMEDYVRKVSPPGKAGMEAEFVFWVLRCLFEVPEPPGFMPRPWIGAAYPPEPANPLLLPRYPLVLLDDIPLYAGGGYMLAGVPQSPLAHIAYFRERGTLRTRFLIPTPRPLDVLAKLESSPQWIGGKPYWGRKAAKNGIDDAMVYPSVGARQMSRRRLREQLLCLIPSVYPMKTRGNFDSRLPWAGDEAERVWKKVVRALDRMPLRWDVSRNEYVRR